MTEPLQPPSNPVETDRVAHIDGLCDQMEQTYEQGGYSKITVTRQWSKHNPNSAGKVAGLSVRPREA